MTLGETGQAIWAAYKAETLDAGTRALVLELARCADTCDRLDGLASARQESWAQLVFDDMGEIHLVIDKILELRLKHQTTLKALYAEVKAARIQPEAKSGPAGGEVPVDMLAKIRKQKEMREHQSG